MSHTDVTFDLYPKQMLALVTEAQHIVYGGAAGGGKSHVARVAGIDACLSIPGIQVYLFRRHYNDLVVNHLSGPTGFRALLFPLMQLGLVKIVDDQIRFYNGPQKTVGSIIHLCHCQYDSDVEKYRGAEIHFFIPEETTQFTENQLRFLMSRVRVPDDLAIPPDQRHRWPRILMPTNPGGVGHSFVKSTYIDGRPEMEIFTLAPEEGGRTCIFIPAKLSDNPSINPTEYRMALLGLKRQELIDAMLEGKWDIPIGSFLPELDHRKHIIPEFEIPNHLFKFGTFDWGSQAPFHVGYWAVMDGNTGRFANGQMLPKGFLLQYREWYGCLPSDTSKGIGMSNEQMAAGMKQREYSDTVAGYITDGLPFQARGALTIAEEFAKYKVMLYRGDVSKGSRIQGAQQLRSRIIGVDGVSQIGWFRECKHTWRVLTNIQTDPNNREDADTSSEDHPYDSVLLAVKSRKLPVREAEVPTVKLIEKAIQKPSMSSIMRSRGDNWL